MASPSFTARPKSAPSRAEPDTVQPKDQTELAREDFELDHGQPDHGEIERLAYGYWLERQDTGGGSEIDDWFRAERALRLGRKGPARQTAKGGHSTL